MARTRKLDTEEAYPGTFPEELFMMIMVFLPFKSLLRFRTVSKWWNAVLKDPHFHKLRPSLGPELVANAMDYTNKYIMCEMIDSTGGLLLMQCTARTRHYIYVIRPAAVSLTRLPRLVCALHSGRMDLRVIGMLVDEKTKEYTVFTTCQLTPTLPKPGDKPNPLGERDRKTRVDLFYYDSATDVWTSCGEGLGLDQLGPQPDAVAVHRDRFMVLTTSKFRDRPQADHYRVFSCNDAGRWEALPGKIPFVGYHRPLLLFDHMGTLHVGVAYGNACALWAYRDDAEKWILIFTHDFGLRHQNFGYLGLFLHTSGDFFHFGVYREVVAPKVGGATLGAECSVQGFRRRVVYNLVTREREDVTGTLVDKSRDELNVLVVNHPRTRSKMLLHPE